MQLTEFGKHFRYAFCSQDQSATKNKEGSVCLCVCMCIYIKINYHTALLCTVPDNSFSFNALAKKMRKWLSKDERINGNPFNSIRRQEAPSSAQFSFALTVSWEALEDTVRLIPALSKRARTIVWKNRSKARIYLWRKKMKWKEAKTYKKLSKKAFQ